LRVTWGRPPGAQQEPGEGLRASGRGTRSTGFPPRAAARPGRARIGVVAAHHDPRGRGGGDQIGAGGPAFEAWAQGSRLT
jgi:hypothetical protein